MTGGGCRKRGGLSGRNKGGERAVRRVPGALHILRAPYACRLCNCIPSPRTLPPLAAPASTNRSRPPDLRPARLLPPSQDKATFTLVCQAVETAVSLLLVRLLTAGPIARSGASEQQLGLFNFSPAAPFSKPRGWAFWGLCGVLASPAVVGGMASLLGAVGYEKAVGGQVGGAGRVVGRGEEGREGERD